MAQGPNSQAVSAVLARDKCGKLIVSMVTETKFMVVIYFAGNPFRGVWYTMPYTRIYFTTVQLPQRHSISTMKGQL